MSWRRVLTCVLAVSFAAFAGHNPLLPRPQQIRYGPAQLALRGLSIGLVSEPAPEDRFTAHELSSALSVPLSASDRGRSPIRLRRTGAVDALARPGEHAGPDSREAYSLKVTAEGVEVEARSSAGLYYGTRTLRQLVESAGAEPVLPEVEIHDWPSLPYRGIMVDISHGPLPTETEIKHQIDLLASFKSNQYYLYSEASIELNGFPVVNREARLTQDALHRIIAFARERHVDVIPCVELYGHLHDLFRVERYADLAIVSHGADFNPRNPKTDALLTTWIEQLAKLFPSPFFHIGFDETSEASSVRSDDTVPPAKLYGEHFQRVSGLVRRYGKTVLVWSDMFAKYPELIPMIPAGTIVVPWGYDRTVYEPYWNPFEDSPLPRFVASGVSIWDQVAPNFPRSFDNIDAWLKLGRKHGVLGLINTLWADDVGVLMRPAFPGIAYGAASAWQEKPVDRTEFFSDYAGITYPAAAAAEASAGMEALGRSEAALAHALGQGHTDWEETSPSYWDDPLTPAHLARATSQREQFRQTRLLAEEAEEHLSRAQQQGGNGFTLSQFLLEARMLDYAGMKNVYAAELADFWLRLGPHPKTADVTFYLSGQGSSHDHSRIADLMDASGDLKQSYERAWRDSYTPYRLGTVLGKWDAEFQYWWKLKRRLDQFIASFHDGDKLPPLESFSPGP